MEESSTVEENGILPVAGDVNSDDEDSLLESELSDSDEYNDADVEEDGNDDESNNENKDAENEQPDTNKNTEGTKKGPKKSSSKKRKRKRKDKTQRRQIRQILDESQLEKETLNAQLEEKERLRRLELQKSLATEGHSPLTGSNSAPPCNSNSDSQSQHAPLIVDLRQKSKQQSQVIVIDSDDEISVGNDDQQHVEVISSGSEFEGICSSDIPTSESDTDTSDIDENNAGLHSDDTRNMADPDGKVLVNTDHPLSEDDIYLAPQIAKFVKPHQIGGIRFLFDNLVETLARYQVSTGFGCILAHSMGLGKTLQVIAFTDIFLRQTTAKKVLIVVPINTIQNWMVEFDMWLPARPETVDKESTETATEEDSGEIRYRNFEVYLLGDNNKSTIARAKVIGLWNQKGGVLLMGYELYRILAMSTPCMASNKCAPPKKKKTCSNSASNQEPEIIDLEEEEKHMDFLIGIQKALCKPGPDLVICDEGHRIKNNQANISQALKRIRTRRRVVLTGYPLQNNLIEYWCMVDFVRPNFLGTRHEFANMFERPILNGQCSDSTPSDVKLMRYRAHVLHSLLEGFVQRRSQSVLKKCLPFKEEHIILIKLSAIQSKLYNAYINYLLESAGHLNPIKGFHTCTKIWNHPDVFFSLLDPKKYGKRNESPLTLLENETNEAINVASNGTQESASSTTTTPPQAQEQPLTTIAASLAWAKDIMKDYKPFVVENGGKVAILMEIITESLKLGEKVLVFSQSLSTLGVIESFLSRQDIPCFPGRQTDNDPTKWAKNKSYYRLDGSTPSLERDRLINAFNSPDNNDVLLFMLSTRAGCLGVNLIGASRVVVFDASWNPCHDVQAVCRVYRYGQKKSTHIYRLVSTGTMEKKIYDRQVSKQGVANRVVDELNPEANFTKQEIMSLICEKEPDLPPDDVVSAADSFSDSALNNICKNYSNWLSKVPFKHESLLVDRKELKLTKTEKREAKKGYEREKNMAQQGGRYYVNPVPEASRVLPTPCSTRPIGTVHPMPTLHPHMATAQAFQPQPVSPYFLQNFLGAANARFARLNSNMTHNPISLSSLMPNVSATVAANIFANQMHINRAVMEAANIPMTTSSGPNPVTCRMPGLPPGQILSTANPVDLNSAPVPTAPQGPREVVTIDLDDMPSSPSPPLVDPVNSTVPEANEATMSTQHGDADHMISQNQSSTNCSPMETGHVTESSVTPLKPSTSVASISVTCTKPPKVPIDANSTPMETVTEPSVSPQKTMTSVVSSSTVTIETEHPDEVKVSVLFNNVACSDNDAVAMETELSNSADDETETLHNESVSIVTTTTGTEATFASLDTRSPVQLAVLQNLLNEQGGLGTRPCPPEESPHSPTGASQI